MRMRKRIPLFLALAYICTACAKTSEPPTISVKEIDWDSFYDYKELDTISQKRIKAGRIRYLDNEQELVDKAIEAIRIRMQKERDWHLSEDGKQMDEELYEEYDRLLGGSGYYISKVPVTLYNNNLNRLWDSFDLYLFNEDMELIGRASVDGLNGEELDISTSALNRSEQLLAAEKMPDMEFIMIDAEFYGHRQFRSYCLLLGEDNRIYDYRDDSGEGVVIDEKRRTDGDAFHALPEEMRFSYNEIADRENLVWASYE